MTRLRMTKAVLTSRRQDLAVLRRALPSLDLKRRQLIAELGLARAESAAWSGRIDELAAAAARIAPAADPALAIDDLVRAVRIDGSSRTRLGVELPLLRAVDWERTPYALVDSPPWLDAALALVEAIATAEVERSLALRREELLAAALARTVQRINLLEQRLVPEAERDIRRIGQFLADGERTAVARAKLVLRRRAAGVAA